MSSPTDHLLPLLAKLTLEEKAALIQGADFWTTIPLPSIGLRALTLSDGPAGVRGPRWDERDPSLNLPSGSALAASWDVDLAYRYGAAAASEARRKGVDVVLGPTINLQRTPLGGRNFECFSEDPELTAALAATYVAGLQDNGVGACPKHYVANDSETDRFTVNVKVGERPLREVYLAPFERAVEAGAWSIMSAYNSVDGVTMTENDLLESPLNDEWGFDGVVISDWTAVRSLAAIPAAQDLAMPGPAPAYDDLLSAINDGLVQESDLDRKVLRLLLLAERVGALGDASAAVPAPLDGTAFARTAAIQGSVLLANDGALPLDAAALSRIALIGHNAREARTQGGGSATVLPAHVVSPLEGLREALPHVQIDYEIGAVVQEGVSRFPLETIANPITGEPGARVTFFDADGEDLSHEDRRSTELIWFGGDSALAGADTLEIRAAYTPQASGTILLGFSGSNPGKIFVDGELALQDAPVARGNDLGAAITSPVSATVTVPVTVGIPVDVRAEFSLATAGTLAGSLSVTVGIAPDDSDPDGLIARAVAAATGADVAIVVVGTNSRVESEGHDRENLVLPGRQDDLVRAVAAVNPRTIVIVNAGSPVALPWAGEVSAILHGYFGGEQFGSAIASMMIGTSEPGGRLPTTWPAALSDAPTTNVVPENGRLTYDEGIHVGYRSWLTSEAEPAFPFGHGLGYTTWSWGAVTRVDDTLEVLLSNTGLRAGKQVVQVYAERPDSTIERPARWLVGFAVVHAAAGETVTVTIPIDSRRLTHWTAQGWSLEEGRFTLRAGASVHDLPLACDWEPQPAIG
ncbi:beta-glucosidase [Microbacterium foliorum]|uniref:beta-glucosidase n=1 Tax=Microbacterium foliorum TaxID=104336 RepID=UPI0005EC0B10|nr:glycoside hydrolase family 3 C-terminal domain-containing protein [Microbacterium foliorum]